MWVSVTRRWNRPSFASDSPLALGVLTMNPINNAGSNNPIYKVTSNPIQKQVPTDAAANAGRPSASDRVELSGVGHLLKSLKNNDVRADKVADIKAQIASGTYEDDAKMDVAVDRMLDDLLK
jgi:negative regulator of flagellin synthesis FlgM